MVTRNELLEVAGAAFIEECAKQGFPPDAWDNLGDGESLMWLGEPEFDTVNIAVIVDAVVTKLEVVIDGG